MDAETLNHLLNDRCHPLRPAFVKQDEKRYLALDDIAAKFAHFCKVHSEPARFTKQGHLVYVTGRSGSGKTSLLHRCAHHLKQQLSNVELNVVLVDLTANRWPERESKPRFKRTLKQMAAELAKYADKETINRLRGTIDDDEVHACTELSGVLSRLSPALIMVVLLSPEPTADELLLVAGAAEPRLVFFAELADPEQIERCVKGLPEYRSPTRSIVELKVGALKDGDGRLLVDGIADYEKNLPAIPDNVVAAWIERNTRSITFVKRLTLGVRLLAQDRNGKTVEAADVAEYFTLMGGQDGR